MKSVLQTITIAGQPCARAQYTPQPGCRRLAGTAATAYDSWIVGDI